MSKSPGTNWFWIVIVLLGQLALVSCAIGPGADFYSFSFSAWRESPDVEVLDYKYEFEDGSQSKNSGVRAERSYVAKGLTFSGYAIAGYMPRGKTLYVKWRIKASGEIHEKTIELKDILPKNMDHKGFHFVVKETDLVIYCMPPPGSWDPYKYSQINIDPRAAAYIHRAQIYPPVEK